MDVQHPHLRVLIEIMVEWGQVDSDGNEVDEKENSDLTCWRFEGWYRSFKTLPSCIMIKWRCDGSPLVHDMKNSVGGIDGYYSTSVDMTNWRL